MNTKKNNQQSKKLKILPFIAIFQEFVDVIFRCLSLTYSKFLDQEMTYFFAPYLF